MRKKVLWAIAVVGIAVSIVAIVLSIPVHSGGVVFITIRGLNDTYKVGQRIDFSVHVIGGGGGCPYFPSAVYVQDLKNNATIWRFDGTRINAAMLCPPGTARGQIYNTTQGVWEQDGRWIDSPIIINQPGSYQVVANYYNETEVEEDFKVIAS